MLRYERQDGIFKHNDVKKCNCEMRLVVERAVILKLCANRSSWNPLLTRHLVSIDL